MRFVQFKEKGHLLQDKAIELVFTRRSTNGRRERDRRVRMWAYFIKNSMYLVCD